MDTIVASILTYFLLFENIQVIKLFSDRKISANVVSSIVLNTEVPRYLHIREICCCYMFDPIRLKLVEWTDPTLNMDLSIIRSRDSTIRKLMCVDDNPWSESARVKADLALHRSKSDTKIKFGNLFLGYDKTCSVTESL